MVLSLLLYCRSASLLVGLSSWTLVARGVEWLSHRSSTALWTFPSSRVFTILFFLSLSAAERAIAVIEYRFLDSSRTVRLSGSFDNLSPLNRRLYKLSLVFPDTLWPSVPPGLLLSDFT